VQDTKRLAINERHGQNQRSPTGRSAATRHKIEADTPGIAGILKVAARLRPLMVNKK
jgi:hypothetical protein